MTSSYLEQPLLSREERAAEYDRLADLIESNGNVARFFAIGAVADLRARASRLRDSALFSQLTEPAGRS